MSPCPSEAGFDLALAKLQSRPLSLAQSWPPINFLHHLQLPALKERELQSAFLLLRC